MGRIVDLIGNINETQEVDGVEGRKPVVAVDPADMKIDLQGNIYTEEVVGGITGRKPVVAVDGISGGGGGGGTMDHALLSNLDLANSGHTGIASSADLASHEGNTVIHVTQTDRDNWDGKQDLITPIRDGFNLDIENNPAYLEANGAVPSVGIRNRLILSDHIHPTDTTRAAASDLSAHESNTVIHVDQSDRDRWDDTTVVTDLANHVADTVIHVTQLNKDNWDSKEPAIIPKRTGFNLDIETDSTEITMNGTRALGTSNTLCFADHTHPNDSSKADLFEFLAHADSTPIHVSATDRIFWNGKADLDSNGKLVHSQIPDSLLTGLIPMGVWDAQSNVPYLANGFPDENGQFYIAQIAGNQFGVDFEIGDWAVNSTGTWNIITNTSQVRSVNGMKGDVYINQTHIGLDLVDNTADLDKPISTATALALSEKEDVIVVAALDARVVELENKQTVNQADFENHTLDVDIHTSLTEKEYWNGKQDSLGTLNSANNKDFEDDSLNITQNGIQSSGLLDTVARGDHTHPVDDSRASQADLDTHESDAVIHVTQADKDKWNTPSGGVTNHALLSNLDLASSGHTGIEPTIIKNTAFNPNFETITTNILMDGAVSVGTSANVARSNHRHPTDTSREPLIGTKNSAFNSSFNTVAGNVVMAGTASAGTSTLVSRADHRHPTDTSRAAATHTHEVVNNASSTAIGSGAMASRTSFTYNTGLGFESLKSTNSGSYNTAVGASSMAANTTGTTNVAVGASAMTSNTSGANNTAVGENASRTNTNSNDNTAIGKSSLYGNTGSSNTGLGSFTLYNCSSAGNTAVGSYSMYSCTSGLYNTAAGYSSARLNTSGLYNTALGMNALYSNGTGSYNSAIGSYALYSSLSVAGCIAIGYEAGRYYATSSVPATQTDNIYIGRASKAGGTSVLNEIAIGYGSVGGGSNTITLGNASITKLRCQVTAITALSDARLKYNVDRADTSLCYQSVKALPVSRYSYKDFTGAHDDKSVTGFMADDVEMVFPKSVSKSDVYFPVLDEHGNQVYEDAVTIDDQGNEHVSQVASTFLMEEVKSITMTEAVPTMWGAMQELMAMVEELKKVNEKMNDKIVELESKLA